MAQNFTKEILIVMSNESGGGRVSAPLSAFLAFDRELTHRAAVLVQRWMHTKPLRRAGSGVPRILRNDCDLF